MSDLNEMNDGLQTARPASWEDLPDISLYMDQLISYMPRQLAGFDQGEKLTSAMVNNYIKAGLVPRAEGKRYHRSHLAQLTAVCALKQVLTLGEMDILLKAIEEDSPEAQYANLTAQMDAALTDATGRMDGEEDLPQLALQLALQSYANQLACRRILEKLAPKPTKKSK